MNNKNCKLCNNYKDGYCKELELKPNYPENGCDYFIRSYRLMNDILVIKAPFPMKKEAMKRTYEEILKQMDSGLVLLPPGFSADLCPKDVEVKFMDCNNDIFEGGGE